MFVPHLCSAHPFTFHPHSCFVLLGGYQGGCCWGAFFTHRLLEGNGVVLWCGVQASHRFFGSNNCLNCNDSSSLTLHLLCDGKLVQSSWVLIIIVCGLIENLMSLYSLFLPAFPLVPVTWHGYFFNCSGGGKRVFLAAVRNIPDVGEICFLVMNKFSPLTILHL